MNQKLLIANRGEIAIRIINTAYELDIRTVTVYAEDDAQALHTKKSDETYPLKGQGAAAYLDIDQIIAIAKASSCTLVHPGYGFLSENATFAKACEIAGLKFVGPKSDVLEIFGSKIRAKQAASRQSVPLILGTEGSTTLEEAQLFFQSLPPNSQMMIKSVSGGGGRGMRIVDSSMEIANAYKTCQLEAEKAFGNGDLYVELYLPKARHVEVQILGDGEHITHLWERECSVQRQHQKLLEIAPCPNLSETTLNRIRQAAVRLAKSVNYTNVGTFEFLVTTTEAADQSNFYFLEANPRIQVEHTVTEEVTGVDIVRFQILQTLGYQLADLGLSQSQVPQPFGYAIQARINTEKINNHGVAQLKTGQLTHFELPFGKGVRVETAGYVGYQNSSNFDSLLAKIIVHSPFDDFGKAVDKLYRKLSECRLEGIETNLHFLQTILQHKALRKQTIYTKFIEENIASLLPQKKSIHPQFYITSQKQRAFKSEITFEIPEGYEGIYSPMPGTVADITVQKGQTVEAGTPLLILEAMKMESVVSASNQGVIDRILVEKGVVLQENQLLFLVKKVDVDETEINRQTTIDLAYIRPELAELNQRKAFLLDENRPEAIAKRKRKNKQTARENIAQLCDDNSFLEYGSLIVAAQRKRRTEADLVKNTPADGIITGIGAVNGALFSAEAAKCMILCYDYTVLAGTQGMFGHQKTDRVLEVAHSGQLPVILFAEGGGGRPGDTDFQGIGGLHVKTFAMFAKLNGIAPRIAIVSGYCFAGNAALAGCADVIIATEDTSMGMGGPAMIEGGGLGKYHPKEVGPVSVQAPNGVIDIVVKNEQEAVETAKKYLSYFQGKVTDWSCADQRTLRHLIPENRRRVYDIRTVIDKLADDDSVLELRSKYGLGIITALIRIEGQPMGLIANNSKHLGGAIDAEGAGKAARFLQLCEVFGLPVLSLCDTPGFMVGPEAEKTGLVRHTSRLFTIGAKMSVPIFTVVLRKAYGLGSMGMAAGGFHEPFFTISWPTGEFGGMGLEGAVRLGYRKELEAIEDEAEREQLFQKMVTKAYQHGKAINTATYLEIDEVIDPADTRKWIVNGLAATQNRRLSEGRKFVDTW
ncbi:MAG: carboxyl transferase domain-containing protein [Bacteroidota bacterium]